MTRLRLAPCFIAALVACRALLGCGAPIGGQTGGEQPATDECDVAYEALTLDALTPLGVTAASVLQPVLGTNRAPLSWSSNTGNVTIGPEQGLSDVELVVSYEGGRIAWARYALTEPSETTGSAPGVLLGCAVDRLEIELDVQLHTGGGALAERFVATLGAPTADNAQLTTRLALDSLAGSFFVTLPNDTVSAPAIRVTAVWDAFGFRGTIDGEVTTEVRDPGASSSSGGSVGFGWVPFARWPAPGSPGEPEGSSTEPGGSSPP